MPSNAETHTAANAKVINSTGVTCINICNSRDMRPVMSARALGLSLTALVLLQPEANAVHLLCQQLDLEPCTFFSKGVPLYSDAVNLRLSGFAPQLFSRQILHRIGRESALQTQDSIGRCKAPTAE